ncbi:MAG: sugar transporter [Paracoccaceae bacterium]|nr:sugar transporter [Paracoccaceae bacterium]
MAEPARMRRRHWGVLFSFVLLVIAPLALFAAYLWIVADDRYSSTVGFTVRQEEGSSATDLLGGLAGLSGSSSSPDGDVLYEFIRSQQIVRQIDDQLDLRAYFGEYWQSDPLFALWPDASIESLHWYWERMVRVSYDQATGLTELRVLAFDPVTAQTIATAIVAESQSMVNALNEAARSDAISYADIELAQAEERLKQTRAALTEFRTRTQIVDLEADIQGRMGVMNNLQQQLAAELVAFDELSSTTNADDPRVTQAVRRIQVIRDRIAQERLNFATTEVLSTGEDYPTLIAEFEGLSVEREFAEETYRAALAARDSAQANANRQSRYLATYVAPTFAESSQYPERFILFGLASLFVVLGWGIAVLIYYSIRDKA